MQTARVVYQVALFGNVHSMYGAIHCRTRASGQVGPTTLVGSIHISRSLVHFRPAHSGQRLILLIVILRLRFGTHYRASILQALERLDTSTTLLEQH